MGFDLWCVLFSHTVAMAEQQIQEQEARMVATANLSIRFWWRWALVFHWRVQFLPTPRASATRAALTASHASRYAREKRSTVRILAVENDGIATSALLLYRNSWCMCVLIIHLELDSISVLKSVQNSKSVSERVKVTRLHYLVEESVGVLPSRCLD